MMENTVFLLCYALYMFPETKAVICTFNKSNKPIKFWHFSSSFNLESFSPFGQWFVNANEEECDKL